MSIIEALLLGLVQGITEFLPVSSSGHLAILENILKIDTSSSLFFGVILHLGTLGAILGAFRKEIKKMILENCRSIYDCAENIKTYFHNRHEEDAKRYKKIVSNNYRKLLLLLLVSTIPTAVLGFLLRDFAAAAGQNLLAPAIGLFITGIVLFVTDFFPPGKKIPKDVSYGAALAIGIFQGIAVFPGISRSGITIAVCLMFGFNRKFSVKYSFLLAVPSIIGALILEAFQLPGMGLSWQEGGIYVLAAVLAGFVGYFCIQKMLIFIQKRRFRFFAVYCFIIGAAAAAGSFYLTGA